MKNMPDPRAVFPNEYHTSCFIKNVVQAPNIHIGDYTYYDDPMDPTGFERNNVLFNWPKLSDCLKNMGAGSYEKNRPDMYEVLRPYMDIAIANAKRLDKQNEGRKPSESAPGTKVYELVEMLKPYLK